MSEAANREPPRIELDLDHHDGHVNEAEGVFDQCFPVVVHCRSKSEARVVAGLITSNYGDDDPEAEPELTVAPPEDMPLDFALHYLADTHESVDWSDVPSISTSEAAAWTTRLAEAADQVSGADEEVTA